MKTIYAIRDRVAQDLVSMQMYTLFNFKTDEQAARYFADSVLDEKSVLNKHAADYELIRVGTIDDNGKLIPTQAIYGPDGTLIVADWQPEVVITGSALSATLKLEQP